MAQANGKHVVLGIVLLLGVFALPPWIWGQTERIGTVLAVEGTAEVRAAQATAQATEWERLKFRDGIFLNDTVRTAADGKLKVLLRDDAIMTLTEQSEMQFTEFSLNEQQRRSIVNLFVGKIRLLTTRLFGAGSVAEVHTPNAVAGVRGSDELVAYQTPTTQVLCSNGDCYMRDPTQPSRILTIPVGHVAQQTGAPGLPSTTREATASERETITEGTQVTEQDPRETLTTEQQARLQILPTDTPRGELPGLTPTGPPLSAVIVTTFIPPVLTPRIDFPVSPITSGPISPRDNPQITTIPTPDASPQILQNSQVTVIVTIPR